jgi:hypothetical protein
MPKKPEPTPEPPIPDDRRIQAQEPAQASPLAPLSTAGIPVPAFLLEDDDEDQFAGELAPFGSDDEETPTPELSAYGPPPTGTHGDDDGDAEPTPVPPRTETDAGSEERPEATKPKSSPA